MSGTAQGKKAKTAVSKSKRQREIDDPPIVEAEQVVSTKRTRTRKDLRVSQPQAPGHPGGIFGNGSNFVISGSTFTEVHGNYQVNVSGHTSSQGAALSQAISHGAIHDSMERYPAGRCHPGTREEIIKTILEWINDPHPSSDVIWLYGPAGAGKSAIMQTIAELLCELCKEHYGGSFFFASGKPGRDHGDALFSTLAYQIAMCIPCMREAVDNAMAADTILPKKSMDTQLKCLIVEPFSHCRCPPTHSPTILIDGLDECHEPDTQRAILNLIANARCVAGVPLRFLIASRPEYCIRDTFDRQPLFDITKRLDLSDSRQASLDIKKYLKDGFAEIYDKNHDVMAGVKRPWPPTKVVDRLVHDASGQFVYASTVLKFIGDESCDPQRQLDIISTPGPSRASAFSDLDQLYTKILSSYPRRRTLIRVLGGLFIEARLIIIEKCLGIEHGELNMVLRAISSLVYRENPKILGWDEDFERVYGRHVTEITFCHLSFREYLLDGKRSGEFQIDPQPLYDELFSHLFDLVIGGFHNQEHSDPHVVHDYVLISQVSIEASAALITHRLKDLRLAIQDFNARGNSATIQPNHLLDRLCQVEDIIEEVGYNIDDFDHMSDVDRMMKELETAKDECFRRILTSSKLLQVKNLPYLVSREKFHSTSLDHTLDLLGVNRELGKMILIKNAPLIDVYFEAKNGEHNIYTPSFCFADLGDFLSDAERGGIFHVEFRKKIIQQGLVFLNTPLEPQDSDISPVQSSGDLSRFITYILEHQDISNVKFVEDAEDSRNIQAFLQSLCLGDNWTRLIEPGRHHRFEMSFIKWLHRQLIQDPALPLLDGFHELMVEKVGQICELGVMPRFRTTYFADDLKSEEAILASVVFPPPNQGPEEKHLLSKNGIPPYNIHPCDDDPTDALEATAALHWKFVIDANSTITTVLEQRVYRPPMNRAKCFTLFLEYALIARATYFPTSEFERRDILNPFRRCALGPKYFEQWFSHAFPSRKILVGLWTLRHLDLRMNPFWDPPSGFCSGAMNFLEIHGLDPTGELNSWLEDLMSREY